MEQTEGDNLAARVREVRLAKGLTQRVVAIRAGITEQTIREIEAGRNPSPTLRTLSKLAAGLGVPAAELLRLEALPRGGDAPDEPPPAKAERGAA
jgi:transcriptional regulator with XRE-family HTH domain